jgi:hypothetical protein
MAPSVSITAIAGGLKHIVGKAEQTFVAKSQL